LKKKAEDMQILIQAIKIELNPSFSKMAKRKDHSILSKAFSISIFRNIKPPLPLLDLKSVGVHEPKWCHLEYFSLEQKLTEEEK
jgi:hypothetical protein